MNDHRNLHHHQRRLGLRAGLVGCLVLLQVAAHAGTDLVPANPAYQRFVTQYGGNSASMFYGVGGTVLPSASGLAQHASVAGLSPTAGEVSRFAALNSKYGQVPFKVSQTITLPRLAKGIAAVAGGPLGIGLLALPAVMDWMAAANITPDGSGGFSGPTGAYQCRVQAGNGVWSVFKDSCTAAAQSVQHYYAQPPSVVCSEPVGPCQINGYALTVSSAPLSGTQTFTAAQIEPALSSVPRTASQIEAILAQGIEYPEIQPDPVDWVRIDPINPADFIKSPTKTDKKTTTNADGSTIEETKSCWLKGTVQTGASLKLTEVCNTDTVTKSPTGTVTGTTTATTDSESADAATPKDEGGLCDTLIGKLICTDLGDAPNDEIPKTTKDLSYTPEVLFGSGTCPADKVVNLGAFTLPLTNMAQTCGWLADFVKPLAILLATFSATLIVIGAPKE